MEQIITLLLVVLGIFICLYKKFRLWILGILDNFFGVKIFFLGVALIYLICIFSILNSKVNNNLMTLFSLALLLITISIIWNYVREKNKSKNINKKYIVKLIIIIIFFSPLVLLMLMSQGLKDMGNVGNMHDWIGFWGNSLGSIVGIAGAYFVMKTQLREDHKEKSKANLESMLPYFNVQGIENDQGKLCGYSINFVSIRDNNVLRFVRAILFDSTNNAVFSKDLGHEFSNNFFEIKSYSQAVDRLDIEAKLMNGKKVFFSYGNDINGAHMYQEGSEYIQYGGSEKGTVSRAEDFDKAFTSAKNRS